MPLFCRASSYLLLLALAFITSSCQTDTTAIPIPRGEKIFRVKCSSCHILPHPKYYSLDTILEQIEHHKLVKKIKLTAEEEEELILYLQKTFSQK